LVAGWLNPVLVAGWLNPVLVAGMTILFGVKPKMIKKYIC
jgi:hypothetical protein